MKDINSAFDDEFGDASVDFKEVFFKYFFFWRYFLISIFICFSIAFLINRYSHKIYETQSKILIIDKKQSALEMPTAENLFSNSKINLENEMEIMKSFPILEKVVENLKLNISVESIGDVMTSRALKYPFKIKHNIQIFNENKLFSLEINDINLEIINLKSEKKYIFPDLTTIGIKHDLPFEIFDVNFEESQKRSFNIHIQSTDKLVKLLKSKIILTQTGKKSDIIKLSFKSSNFTKHIK